ncbi:MAG TPA: 2-dehydropantoate 2-reductase N-terminal domain-containing protein, partial [Gammaproteobacteria bacterium]
MQKFEFAVLGAGAMGSILGAHLARAGHSVAMLARGRRAEQIRSEGLRISGLIQLSAP